VATLSTPSLLICAQSVYINTLMIQQTLDDPAWLIKTAARDRGALSPLFTNHVNPFGSAVVLQN